MNLKIEDFYLRENGRMLLVAGLLLILAVLITLILLDPKQKRDGVLAGGDTPIFLEVDDTDPTKFSYNGQEVMLKGVNVNNVGALGIWQAANINNIQVGPGDYEKIAELGANHVRFGVSYQWYENDPTGFFSVMDQHISWARENNLWFVPVVFTLPYLGENTDDSSAHANGGCYQGYGNPCNFWGAEVNEVAAREDFKDFWYEFVDRYKDNDTVAGYDFINEPWSVDENYERDITAQEYYAEIINGIDSGGYNSTQLYFLESEPDPLSWIIFAGYSGAVSSLQTLKTTTDNRIVLSSHMYEPSDLTHYEQAVYPTTQDGVTWSQSTLTNPASPDTYPGDVVQTLSTGGSVDLNSVTYSTLSGYLTDYPHDIRNRFGITFAQDDVGVPIYIGEWSAQQTQASDGTGWYTDTFLDYNSDIATLFNSWGVHDAVFVFKAGENNWGLYSDTAPQATGEFTEQVSYNVDSPSITVQPFIDTLSSIWATVVKPSFNGNSSETPVCQNGILEGTEQCDDANATAGDGCSATCTIEKSGPTISGTRNLCTTSASLSDFRFDGHHEFETAEYTDPDSLPADTGYPSANDQLKLGNNGTSYYLPYVWFEDVDLVKDTTVSNAYIDFNLANSGVGSALTADIYGLKVGGNLRTYNPDNETADKYYADRNPYSTYIGGANWLNWGTYSSDSSSSPLVGFPHDVLTRSSGAVYQWPRTTSTVEWSMSSGALGIGEYYATPDISGPLNELLAESGWVSGNDLGFVLIPGLGDSASLRTFYGYDANISTSSGSYSFTDTNSSAARFPTLYANCTAYVSGLDATDDSFALNENESIDGDVTADNGNGADANPGSYTLTYTLVNDVSHGDLYFDTDDGTFTYTPTTGYGGTDSFRYNISDGKGGTDSGLVTFTVAANLAPTVVATITKQGSLVSPYTLQAVASDSDGTVESYSWTKTVGPASTIRCLCLLC